MLYQLSPQVLIFRMMLHNIINLCMYYCWLHQHQLWLHHYSHLSNLTAGKPKGSGGNGSVKKGNPAKQGFHSNKAKGGASNNNKKPAFKNGETQFLVSSGDLGSDFISLQMARWLDDNLCIKSASSIKYVADSMNVYLQMCCTILCLFY